MTDAPFPGLHTSSLASFQLEDMVECGRAMRKVAEGALTMESAARQIVRFLYANFRDLRTGDRNCALVRCFKTHRYGELPVELAQSAGAMVRVPLSPEVPCLTLLASAGELPAWNDRRGSQGHAAIPLVSVERVERAPMIASRFQQMGGSIEAALQPNPQLILDAEQRAFNVFHVEHAEGAPAIPAQDGFVRPYGIRSVLGFGGLLPSGDLFTVILFSRVRISRETASLFRTIALGVKLALLPHSRGQVFDGQEQSFGPARFHMRARTLADGPLGASEADELRSQTATLGLLISALEDAALEQTRRLQRAYDDLKTEGEKVQTQGSRLSAMLEATTDAVFLLDRDWCFTFLNGHAQELIANGADLIGCNIWTAFPGAISSSFGIQYQRVITEGVEVKFQEYYPQPLDRWFEVHAFPSEGGIAVFFHDVTDRRKTEATLRQTEKLAATGRLAASIAHEINNPLEAMTNLLYLVGSDPSLSREAKAYTSLAEAELQRVSEISTHMLRFHRQSTDAVEVDLIEVLESVLVLFKGRLDQANIKVQKRVPSKALLIGFAGELRQIFANLVGNAIDAARLGGRLEIRVRTCQDHQEGQAGIRVTIADTGSGMSRETAARIFEPFFTTKGITGTGLGLWVTMELIQKHSGKVRVRSSEGGVHHGTVFDIFFPVQQTGSSQVREDD